MTGIRDNSRGFSLVELLVAMVIFSVTALTLLSSFNTLLSSGSTIKSEVEQAGQYQLGLRTIAEDMAQIFAVQPPRYQKPEPGADPDPFRFKGE